MSIQDEVCSSPALATWYLPLRLQTAHGLLMGSQIDTINARVRPQGEQTG